MRLFIALDIDDAILQTLDLAPPPSAIW